MSDRSQAIGFLIHDNVTMIDIAGPADVFHHANAFGARYDTVLVSSDGKAKRASNGHFLTAEAAAGDGRLGHNHRSGCLRDGGQAFRAGASRGGFPSNE